MRFLRSIALLSVAVLGLGLARAACAATNPADFVTRLRATGVWHWTSRTQEMQIAQTYDGSRWNQKMMSYERWADSGEYGQLSVVVSPPAMAHMRILGLFASAEENLRWMYARSLGRPRRLPPSRADGFLGNVFAGMTALQRLPFLLQQRDRLKLETPVADTYVLHVPYDDAAMVLKFRGEALLLEELDITTSRGGLINRVRLSDYEWIQGVPTPLSLRIAVPESDRRTYVRFAQVHYNAPLDEHLFGVATFGQTFIEGMERSVLSETDDF